MCANKVRFILAFFEFAPEIVKINFHQHFFYRRSKHKEHKHKHRDKDRTQRPRSQSHVCHKKQTNSNATAQCNHSEKHVSAHEICHHFSKNNFMKKRKKTNTLKNVGYF